MKNLKTQNILDFIKECQKNTDFDVVYYIDEQELEALETAEQVVGYIESLNDNRRITDKDVIYSSCAIDYLQENDPSLQNSLEIAHEYGIGTKDLNSEILASLLASQENEEKFTEFLENLREELENNEKFYFKFHI